MLREFILTVYALVHANRWAELIQYFSLIQELLKQPAGIITPGKPTDKEV